MRRWCVVFDARRFDNTPQVTWEPFYAALVGQGGAKNAAAMAVKLTPTWGEMAPRGKEGERVRQERSDPT